MKMEVAFGQGIVLLEKYRVESVLGRGGMGIILKVLHLHLGEQLAMKVLRPEIATSPEATTRFLREARSAVRLRGEHVARVTDVGILPEGLPFIVMEYLHGMDLSQELKRKTILTPGKAVDYVLQACEALAEAHVHGIVHRDIKPANLFLTTRPDGTPLVKVLDFGISKVPAGASSTLTQTEVVMGTPGYMSPEQMKAAKEVDARSDIWALGIVLYECLSGRRPFDGESFSATVLIAGTEPPPPMSPTVPRGLQAVVLRCLEKDRRARFPTIAALVAALAPFARNQREAATITERTSLMLQRPRRASDLATDTDQAPASTTLSGSAGSGLRPRRRRAVTGGIWLLCSVAALFVVKLVLSGLSHASDERPSIGQPGSGDAAHPAASNGSSSTAAAGPVDAARPDAASTPTVQNASSIAHAAHADLDTDAASPGQDAGLDALTTAHVGNAGSAGEPPNAPASTQPAPPRPLPKPRPPVSSVPAHDRTGVIVVRVKPWAEVWIDGNDVGTTPIREQQPVGPHRVVIANNKHRESMIVTVTASSEYIIEKTW